MFASDPFSRTLRILFALAVALALIASFTVRVHAAEPLPCLKAKPHAHVAPACPRPVIPPCPAPVDLDPIQIAPHERYIIVEVPAPPEPVQTYVMPQYQPPGFWDSFAPTQTRIRAPEIGGAGAPEALTLLAGLCAIIVGRRV